ncbi:MAG TPA: hypothetical protein VK760_07930 [Candidatus Acidoferrales bacterium]|jgi:uncharacterized membrane protein|nr:hypothetical protein [Candidatus Acidoferrales bacterium]
MNQTPSDAPFGLAPNVAAGLAYLLGILGGIVMLAGGGTNKTVKWAAAQSIVMWAIYIVLAVTIPVLVVVTQLSMIGFLSVIAGAIWFFGWIWTSVMAFRGVELRIPVIAGITAAIFKSAA